jgi:hypothetical protein
MEILQLNFFFKINKIEDQRLNQENEIARRIDTRKKKSFILQDW